MENNLQDGRMSKEAARWFIYMANEIDASAVQWLIDGKGHQLTNAWIEFWSLFHEVQD